MSSSISKVYEYLNNKKHVINPHSKSPNSFAFEILDSINKYIFKKNTNLGGHSQTLNMCIGSDWCNCSSTWTPSFPNIERLNSIKLQTVLQNTWMSSFPLSLHRTFKRTFYYRISYLFYHIHIIWHFKFNAPCPWSLPIADIKNARKLANDPSDEEHLQLQLQMITTMTVLPSNESLLGPYSWNPYTVCIMIYAVAGMLLWCTFGYVYEERYSNCRSTG